MDEVLRLSTYPYVVVRIACSSCRGEGCDRLARLADRFGAEALMVDVLKQLSADCPNSSIRRFQGACLACRVMLPDLARPTPPHVTPAVARLRLRIVSDHR